MIVSCHSVDEPNRISVEISSSLIVNKRDPPDKLEDNRIGVIGLRGFLRKNLKDMQPLEELPMIVISPEELLLEARGTKDITPLLLLQSSNKKPFSKCVMVLPMK